jgi:hypothetical protein
MNGFKPEVVTLGDGVTEKDLLVHDAKNPDPGYSFLLANMELPELPVPIGVFRSIEKADLRRPPPRPGREGEAGARGRRSEKDSVRRGNMDGAVMKCPSCGSNNIAGVDECEDCHEDLSSLDGAPKSKMQRVLMSDPLARLAPHPPLFLSAKATLFQAVTTMNAAKVGSVLVGDTIIWKAF